MARIARVVVPGLPHHVTQRSNRREPVFFGAEDYRLYRRLIATAARRADAKIWAYCLMPNHVHLIVTPTDHDGLRATTVIRVAVIRAQVNCRRNPCNQHLTRETVTVIRKTRSASSRTGQGKSLNPARQRVSASGGFSYPSARLSLLPPPPKEA